MCVCKYESSVCIHICIIYYINVPICIENMCIYNIYIYDFACIFTVHAL